MHKNQRKLWKTGVFPLTLPHLKPHCNERQGYPDPHEYRVSCKCCLGRTPHMRLAQCEGGPGNNGGPDGPREGETSMATGMTKTALTRHLAEKQELTNKQAAAFLDLLAETAIQETKKNGRLVIPRIAR